MIVDVQMGAALVRALRDRAVDDGVAAPLDSRAAAYQLGARLPRRRLMAVGVDIGEPGRPRVVGAFLALAITATVLEFAYQGSSPDVAGLARAGGAGIGAIANGAWWKLLTANLLHAGVLHLAMNAFVIFLMGRYLEYVIGWRLTVVVIAWSAVLSSVGALAIGSAPVTIGASGVAFGLTGAAVAVDPRARTVLGMTGRQLAIVNLLFTFVAANVSIGGHLGGFVAGLVAGAVCWRRSDAELSQTEAPERPCPTRLGTSRGAATAVAAALVLPIVGGLLAGPQLLGSVGDNVSAAVVKPLLERQLRGGLSAPDGGTDQVSDAHCSSGDSPRRYRCTLEIDGRRRSAEVVFQRGDDQWRASL